MSQIKVCDTCIKRYTSWNKLQIELVPLEISGPGALSEEDMEHLLFLKNLFFQHVKICRVVAHSVGEELPFETYDKHNRRRRDVTQSTLYTQYKIEPASNSFD